MSNTDHVIRTFQSLDRICWPSQSLSVEGCHGQRPRCCLPTYGYSPPLRGHAIRSARSFKMSQKTEPGPKWIHDTFSKLKQLNISLYNIIYLYNSIHVYTCILLYTTFALSLSHSPLLSLTYFPWTKISNEHVYIHRITWSSNATGNRSDPPGCPQRCRVSAEPCHMHFPGCCLDPPRIISFDTIV